MVTRRPNPDSGDGNACEPPCCVTWRASALAPPHSISSATAARLIIGRCLAARLVHQPRCEGGASGEHSCSGQRQGFFCGSGSSGGDPERPQMRRSSMSNDDRRRNASLTRARCASARRRYPAVLPSSHLETLSSSATSVRLFERICVGTRIRWLHHARSHTPAR